MLVDIHSQLEHMVWWRLHKVVLVALGSLDG